MSVNILWLFNQKVISISCNSHICIMASQSTVGCLYIKKKALDYVKVLYSNKQLLF